MVRAERPELNIQIIDSKTCAGALGFVALEAARAAHQGKSISEVIEVALEMVSKVVYIAALDTLKYLIKIGRAPKHASNFGEFLKVKPIIGFVDDTGLLDVVARVRGKHQSLAKLVELIDKYIDTDVPIHAMVHYTDGVDRGEELKEMLTSRYNCAEVHVTQYTPVMCSATGPTMGLAFYS
jgi:DegV family protein with EDD domain